MLLVGRPSCEKYCHKTVASGLLFGTILTWKTLGKWAHYKTECMCVCVFMFVCVRMCKAWSKYNVCLYSRCKCNQGWSNECMCVYVCASERCKCKPGWPDDADGVVDYAFSKFNAAGDTVSSDADSSGECQQWRDARHSVVSVCVDPCRCVLRPAAESYCQRDYRTDRNRTCGTVDVRPTERRRPSSSHVALNETLYLMGLWMIFLVLANQHWTILLISAPG